MPTHECPAPDCRVQVPHAQLTCKPHWFAIPAEIRSRIWTGYRSANGVLHSQAMQDAISFLQGAARAQAEPPNVFDQRVSEIAAAFAEPVGPVVGPGQRNHDLNDGCVPSHLDR